MNKITDFRIGNKVQIVDDDFVAEPIIPSKLLKHGRCPDKGDIGVVVDIFEAYLIVDYQPSNGSDRVQLGFLPENFILVGYDFFIKNVKIATFTDENGIEEEDFFIPIKHLIPDSIEIENSGRDFITMKDFKNLLNEQHEKIGQNDRTGAIYDFEYI